MNGEQNLRLIREVEANREFMLAVYRQNPALLEKAEARIRELFAPLCESRTKEGGAAARIGSGGAVGRLKHFRP
ncbi:MAG: hypothetical protein MZW92_03705 [Comamonadaceae bacterium]|nr:hypothetical protein [Comamonadaceae bacterium]